MDASDSVNSSIIMEFHYKDKFVLKVLRQIKIFSIFSSADLKQNLYVGTLLKT